jgi:hypothetical protein
MLRKIAYFLCLIDDTPQLSLSNIAFLVILGKIIVTPSVDWTALVTLAITCLNVMHDRHVNTTSNSDVQTLTDQLSDLQNKISPILDKVKLVL